MDAQLEVKLIECLDALARGESPDRILERYPQDAAQLRSLLQTAAGLPILRMEPSEATKLRARREFLAQADALRRSTPRRRSGFVPRFAMGFLAAALVAVVLSTGAVAASGSALPGDPLYGLKRTVENVRLGLSSGAGQKVLTDQFAQRRLDEINQLLSAGRPGEVEFRGTIEALQPAAWIVSGVVVQLDAKTQIKGTPQIDRMVEVHAITGPQGLRALSILIEAASETITTPTPAPTESPTLAVTPQATDSPEPTRTTAATPTPSAAVTRPPRSTAQPTPRPTVPPATPAEVEFTGTVQVVNSGAWDIDGTIVLVDANTQFGGPINVGQRVKVKALRFSDEQLVAQQIDLLDNGGQDHNNNQNSDQNSNQNSNENGDGNNGNSHGGNNNDNHNDNSNAGGEDSHGGNENHNSGDNSNSHEGSGNGN